MDFVEFSFSVFFLQPFWKLAKLYKIACTYEQGTGKTIIFPKENMQNSQMGREIFFKQNLIILCTQLTDGSHSTRFSTFSEGCLGKEMGVVATEKGPCSKDFQQQKRPEQ